MYCDFVSCGFFLLIIFVNLVNSVDYYDSNYPVRTGSELHVSYGAPTRNIGQHPNCGETPEKFDRLCCEDGRKRLEEELKSLRRRGMDADVPSLVWLPGSGSGSGSGQAPASCYINYSVHTNLNKGPVYGGERVDEESEPECYRFRSKEECCSANASHRNNPCRWYTTQRKCAKAMKSQQTGPFGITLKTTQRCS